MRVRTGNGLQLTLNDDFKAGRSGRVYTVREYPQIVVKIYMEDAPRHVDRVRAMVRSWRPTAWLEQGLHLAWPLDTVTMDDGAVVGFAMERLDSDVFAPIQAVLKPGERARAYPGSTWESQFRVARNLARAVARLHRNDVVVGDLSEKNVWVSKDGVVAFLDCDSMQFRDAESGTLFPSLYITEDVAPPELLEGQDPGVPRRPESDNFTLAVIVCQLLMDGAHPFRGVPRQGSSTHRTDNVLSGDAWLLHPQRMKRLRQWPQHPSDVPLPPRVLTLAEQCFGPGLRTLERRPTAAAWAEVLGLAMEELRTCDAERTHVFHRGATDCPWCRRDGRTTLPVSRPVPAPPTRPTPQSPAVEVRPPRSGAAPVVKPPPPPKPVVPDIPPALVVVAVVLFFIFLALLVL
ncbi:MAG TPA: hypothetical protein VGB24_10915 [Longimicrobium sp.]|jgi:DNA-binding helix-hairpin-helix protein with protein kinase domain|uniref:hypothetical protein n=1 Tax=Longimicrobium sp. TaxID=2029185 RepID=UPI002ED8D74C